MQLCYIWIMLAHVGAVFGCLLLLMVHYPVYTPQGRVINMTPGACYTSRTGEQKIHYHLTLQLRSLRAAVYRRLCKADHVDQLCRKERCNEAIAALQLEHQLAKTAV